MLSFFCHLWIWNYNNFYILTIWHKMPDSGIFNSHKIRNLKYCHSYYKNINQFSKCQQFKTLTDFQIWRFQSSYMLGQIMKYLWCNAKLSITHSLPAQLITEPVIHGLGDALSYQVLDIHGNGFTSSHLEEDGPKIQTALGEKIRNFVNNLWSLTIKDGVNIKFKTASSSLFKLIQNAFTM